MYIINIIYTLHKEILICEKLIESERKGQIIRKKWTKYLSKQFTKETRIDNKLMKKCSFSFVIKEMQSKTRCHFIPNTLENLKSK